MWRHLIRWSLHNRVAVLVLAVALLVWGGLVASRMTVDVLPDITAPTVTVMTEAPGMAPDEVETLITLPLETALNGAPRLRRLRSSSGIGLSIVWVEFDWDVDPYRARQVVAERLQAARSNLPEAAGAPTVKPMASIMGEIMFIGLTGAKGFDPMRLRDLGRWQERRRQLSIQGVSQVMPTGGQLKQIQIVLDPSAMRRLGVGHRQVLAALRSASTNRPGGFHVSGHQEYLIRGVARARSLDEVGLTVVARRAGSPVLLRQVAHVKPGPAPSRGTGSIDGEAAVVLAVVKAPAADTLTLTRRIDEALDSLAGSLPKGVSLYRKGFRQARFIQVAIGNVTRHIAESSVLVVVLLFLFLMSWRTTLISLVALPLSLITGVLVLHALDAGINTMTLGGLAIAIGALVDDAIIDVENVYRRLRQRAQLPAEQREPLLSTVLSASLEIRPSIVHATLVIVIVFLPLFFLSGLEGRLMVPLGTAYVASLLASLAVAVTVTPALCLLLLRRVPSPEQKDEPLLPWCLKKAYAPALNMALSRPRLVAALSLAGVALAVVTLLSFGRSFLPRFSEGSFTIAAATVAGTPLSQSDRMAGRLERALTRLSFVTSVIRRTGRAELDEHAQDVQYSELEVTVNLDSVGRARAARRIRAAAAAIPGLAVSVGQPISHRVEHMLSGVKTSIAVKIYGSDLPALRALAAKVKTAMEPVKGVVDLAIEPLVEVPQTVIRPRFVALAQVGITPGELAEFVQTAFLGQRVGQLWQDQRAHDLVVRLPHGHLASHHELSRTPIDADGRVFTPLARVARVQRTMGPNLINRENVQRRMVVMANVAGRDIRSVIQDIRRRVKAGVTFPSGYHVDYGGEFESEARASRTISLLSLLAVLAMAGILWAGLRSLRDALLVMTNLPLALVGGALSVWATGGVLSIAHLVGLVTLFGIATRNGIMMVTHYRHLMDREGASLAEAVRRGSMERLVPVLMTALATGLALVPIAMAAGEPGNEIQAPMALVVLGGLLTSTTLNMLVLPALYGRLGRLRRPQPTLEG